MKPLYHSLTLIALMTTSHLAASESTLALRQQPSAQKTSLSYASGTGNFIKGFSRGALQAVGVRALCAAMWRARSEPQFALMSFGVGLSCLCVRNIIGHVFKRSDYKKIVGVQDKADDAGFWIALGMLPIIEQGRINDPLGSNWMYAGGVIGILNTYHALNRVIELNDEPETRSVVSTNNTRRPLIELTVTVNKEDGKKTTASRTFGDI